jgi:pyruvate/2-oxoglutarate dehydrogenase complex dihydrolipoamide acyltransferase (E2) component
MKKYLDLQVPDLGDSEKIELIKWYVNVGDQVNTGQELGELTTDKVVFTMEAPLDGIVSEIIVKEGANVKKGETIGRMELAE